jgi:NAD-dependent deacetylase
MEGGTAPASQSGEIARLAKLLRGAGSVVALTGAGISTPSGIPDFRSPGTGLWENVDPMAVAHIDAFRADPVRFWSFYSRRFASLSSKRPNGAHEALAQLERDGVLDAVITQNIDMLHRAAGTRELLEVHGSIASCSCLHCGETMQLAAVRELLRDQADGVPRCGRCGEPLKPDVVLFGELLHEPTLARARELCERADVLLCVGSSLEVHPVAALPMLTLHGGGALAIITRSDTPLDDLADVRLRGDVVEELAALVRALGAGETARSAPARAG